uniref:Uncharacterized protein n=1 Tax=Globisporangium ultimum (strain ATCC 200006 / CBS 805.95 / DAOM BR144) TaxID=431595 RepID=K3XDK5_GLOUD
MASGATILMPGAIARDKSHGSRSRGTKYKRKEKAFLNHYSTSV